MSKYADYVQVLHRGTASAAAQTSIGTTAAQLLAINPNRRGLMIQNTGTTILKLLYGSGTPTQSIYHLALAAGTAADDGKGGVWVEDAWVGAMQIISSGAGGTCVVTEIS